jgi:hypothetical protein
MALTISLDVSIDSDRENASLSDETVYGTGGNPARADVRVFVSGFKMSYENEATDLTVTGDDEDPETDSSWRFNIPEDGYFKFYVSIITDEYDTGTTYDQYDAVYDGNTVYRSVVANNLNNALNNPTYWEEITDPASLANNKGQANESTNITSTIYLRVLSPNSAYYFANMTSDNWGAVDTIEDEPLQNYIIFRMWLDAVAIADSRSEVLDGELICRRIQAKFIDCQ